MAGPKSGRGWVREWGGGMGDFWVSIGNVNEEYTLKKSYKKRSMLSIKQWTELENVKRRN
jgi:hypothetical protein